MKDILEYLQDLLKAEHIGEYAPGHMGAKILRFRSLGDSRSLIVKLAENGNLTAIQDIEANLIGYSSIQSLGGEHILPLGLRELTLENWKALVMADLGKSLRQTNGGIPAAKILWRNFQNLIIATRQKALVSANDSFLFISEVLSIIEKFGGQDEFGLLDLIKQADLSDDYGQSALMLLDFTPDNLFLNDGRLSFIDPWKQTTYLGHPAISIGQFLTLAKIYSLADNEKIADFLRSACLTELPAILGCSISSINKAIRLGVTLQLVLSAYVRQKSDPQSSNILKSEAKQLWQL
ncbi:MAG: hypothetical protein WC453_00965 [Patescibacteria group bacterium]